MRHYLLILIFLCAGTSFLQAQRVKAELVVNRWVGGVCCVSGTNYSLSFITGKNQTHVFDSVRLELSTGAVYTLSEQAFNRSDSGDTVTRFSVNFGHSRNETPVGYPMENESCFGPEALCNFRWEYGEAAKKGCNITLIRNGKETLCKSVSVEETMTAYP